MPKLESGQTSSTSTGNIVVTLPKQEKMIVSLKGGKGSGHKGHRGRPGLVGGSLPGVGGVSPVQHGEYSVYTVGYGEELPHHITHKDGRLMFMLDPKTRQLHVAPEHVDHATIASAMGMSSDEYDRLIRGYRWDDGELAVSSLGMTKAGELWDVAAAYGEYDPAEAMGQVLTFARALRGAGFPNDATLLWFREGAKDIELPLMEWKEYVSRRIVVFLKGSVQSMPIVVKLSNFM